MAHYVLFDGPYWESLFPLTLTRPVSLLRIGGLTIQEKWEYAFGRHGSVSIHTQPYLRPQFTSPKISYDQATLLINGSILPNAFIVSKINNLQIGQSIWAGDLLVATYVKAYSKDWDHTTCTTEHGEGKINVNAESLDIIQYPEQIFLNNGAQIKADVAALTNTRYSQEIPQSVKTVGDAKKLFIEEGVNIQHAIINTESGPVYIGRGATILEGCLLRGPLYIGENAVVKMGAKIYGETTIGPNCKVGGEIKRAVLYANSSKGHDGYLGDSVVGEWCNFGADTNTSNMKNTYGHVQLWDIAHQAKRNTKEQFCGTIMGDHTRCAINTQFNTGTVTGVFANIFGPPPDTFIDSFSWGLSDQYNIDKAIEVAKIVYNRKGKELSLEEERILRHIHDQLQQ